MDKVCCFIGHRVVENEEETYKLLLTKIEVLILEYGIKVFLLGSNSKFNDLAYKALTELKKNYSEISRVFVRAEYQEIWDYYKDYLLSIYDDTYFAVSAIGAGKNSYIKRNEEMINKSDICIFYYNENYLPKRRQKSKRGLSYQPQSGTSMAYNYAKAKQKESINLYNKISTCY